MIEKLNRNPSTIYEIVDKINEIVDAVNEISTWRFETDEDDDPYEEERQWIGKLCWFWDSDDDEKTLGVFDGISTSDILPYIKKGCKPGYEHCEPVKPDDDIFYKGE